MNILVNSYETLKNAILAVNAAEERAVIEFGREDCTEERGIVRKRRAAGE